MHWKCIISSLKKLQNCKKIRVKAFISNAVCGAKDVEIVSSYVGFNQMLITLEKHTETKRKFTTTLMGNLVIIANKKLGI